MLYLDFFFYSVKLAYYSVKRSKLYWFQNDFFLFQLSITLEEYVLAGFLALSLLTSLIVVPLSKFRMSRPYGIGLIVLYVIFLVVALLTESNVITADI